jgi:hypothetical protein
MIADWCDVGKVTINVLPDDVLLGIFDCYVDEATKVEAWHTPVRVCRRWRGAVLGSPRRLNLRIACTTKTSVREKLDVWPRLPIVVSGDCDSMLSVDNIKADIFAALEKPFPVLTDLDLSSQWPVIRLSVDPDPLKFLGGSTHLRSFHRMALHEWLSSETQLLTSHRRLVSNRCHH